MPLARNDLSRIRAEADPLEKTLKRAGQDEISTGVGCWHADDDSGAIEEKYREV
jgi:hypothetical protein